MGSCRTKAAPLEKQPLGARRWLCRCHPSPTLTHGPRSVLPRSLVMVQPGPQAGGPRAGLAGSLLRGWRGAPAASQSRAAGVLVMVTGCPCCAPGTDPVIGAWGGLGVTPDAEQRCTQGPGPPSALRPGGPDLPSQGADTDVWLGLWVFASCVTWPLGVLPTSSTLPPLSPGRVHLAALWSSGCGWPISKSPCWPFRVCPVLLLVPGAVS